MRRSAILWLVSAAMLLSGCEWFGDDGGGGSFEGVDTAMEQEAATRERIIRAVHDHLEGKTYLRIETEWVDNVVSCSDVDADLDVLGTTCSGSGGLYGRGTKIVSRPIDRQVQLTCPAPPPVDSPSWRLEETGEDSWRVWNPQGEWDVVGRSDGGFAITARQDC